MSTKAEINISMGAQGAHGPSVGFRQPAENVVRRECCPGSFDTEFVVGATVIKQVTSEAP